MIFHGQLRHLRFSSYFSRWREKDTGCGIRPTARQADSQVCPRNEIKFDFVPSLAAVTTELFGRHNFRDNQSQSPKTGNFSTDTEREIT